MATARHPATTAPGTRGTVVVVEPDESGMLTQAACWVTPPTPLTSSANSSADTSRKKLADTARDSGSRPAERAHLI